MPKQIDPSSIVAGINPVEALLRGAPGKVNHLVLLHGGNHKKLHELQRLAVSQNIRVHQLPKARLDSWYKGQHQGVLAFCNSRPLDDWGTVKAGLLRAKDDGIDPMVVVPAAMEDPRNLGACIRSAVCLGADAVLAHNKGGAGLTPAVAKTAAGALEEIAICQVGDIEKELMGLKEAGFAVLGLEAEGGQDILSVDFSGPMALVVGGEDRGIPPHVKRTLTGLVRIPMAAGAHSFNASVALSLMLYEANRQGEFQRLARSRPKFHNPGP
jgi:23S rRNA (guanosine2251-2'-O)-methyltransferase